MKAYSNDLRAKIIAAYERGNSSQVAIARFFGVSESTVRNFLRRKRLRGSSEALPHRGGRSVRATDSVKEFVITTLRTTNDLTLQELRDAIVEHCGLRLSVPTLSRLVLRLGFTRKKKSGRQRATDARGATAA
jgi:transposase